MERLFLVNEKYGLPSNVFKTKVMIISIVKITNLKINNVTGGETNIFIKLSGNST